jgi:hypothetical protein
MNLLQVMLNNKGEHPVVINGRLIRSLSKLLECNGLLLLK